MDNLSIIALVIGISALLAVGYYGVYRMLKHARDLRKRLRELRESERQQLKSQRGEREEKLRNLQRTLAVLLRTYDKTKNTAMRQTLAQRMNNIRKEIEELSGGPSSDTS